MEILIPDPTYDHPERDREKFLAELKQELAELSPEFELSEADAGHGADWPAILVSLGGLFLLGKPIKNNLDAWASLAKRFGTFVARAKELWSAPHLDQDGATLIALSRVLEMHRKPIHSIEVVGTVPTWFRVFPRKDPNRLDHHPDALYVTSFRVNDDTVHVLGIKSKGTIEFEHEFSPHEVSETPSPTGSTEVPTIPSPSTSGSVFIIHGHDELNLLRLKELLKDRWKLEYIVLSSEPGKGRTLVEKFEEEAQRAGFALALFSPDDFVAKEGDKYGQARPNVVFELGWFYGSLGRGRVCILFKKGTKIHSDLDGISRIEFAEDVREKIVEIERELLSSGIMKK